jgi:hypothetical protein
MRARQADRGRDGGGGAEVERRSERLWCGVYDCGAQCLGERT